MSGLVANWELVLRKNKNSINCHQLLRLGPMSSSIDLEKFLINFEGMQILIKEKNYRKLDPIKKSFEYDFGLSNFTNLLLEELSINEKNKKSLIPMALNLIEEGNQIKEIFKAITRNYWLANICRSCVRCLFWFERISCELGISLKKK